MGLTWEESYLGRLRALAGDQVLLMVGARCVVRDDAGRVLLIQRSDRLHWTTPAGTLEIGESIADCARREVLEETGLTVTALTPFALHTGPAHTVTNPFGDTYQVHSLVLRADEWTGTLLTTTGETLNAAFFSPAALPAPLSHSVRRTLTDLAQFELTGRFVLD